MSTKKLERDLDLLSAQDGTRTFIVPIHPARLAKARHILFGQQQPIQEGPQALTSCNNQVEQVGSDKR